MVMCAMKRPKRTQKHTWCFLQPQWCIVSSGMRMYTSSFFPLWWEMQKKQSAIPTTHGIVLQLKNLTTVKESIHYLRVGKFVGAKLQIHWHSLKKHLPLAEYSTAGVSAVNKIFRHTLAFVDGGYLLNICWISAENKSPHPVFQTEVSREPTLPK